MVKKRLSVIFLLLGIWNQSIQVYCQDGNESANYVSENIVNEEEETPDFVSENVNADYDPEDLAVEGGGEEEEDDSGRTSDVNIEEDDYTDDGEDSGRTSDVIIEEDDYSADVNISGKATCLSVNCYKRYKGKCGRWTASSTCKYTITSPHYCSPSSVSSCSCCVPCGGSCGIGGKCRASCYSTEYHNTTYRCSGTNCKCCYQKPSPCGGKCGGSCGGTCKSSCSSGEDKITAYCSGKNCVCCKPISDVRTCSGQCGGSCGGYCKSSCSVYEDKISAHCQGTSCSCCRRKDGCSGRCGYLNRYYCRNYCSTSNRVTGTCSGSHCTCCKV